MRTTFAVVTAALLLTFALAATAMAKGHAFTADLQALNDSGATGTATITVDGDQVTVEIEASGLTPGAPHAQHLHIGGDNTCPGADADTDDDGLVTTPEGQPFYGDVAVSLTLDGDVSPDSVLAVDRFPVADDSGAVSYSRTFSLPDGVSTDMLGDAVVVQHGVDLNDSGTYDGDEPSPLNPDLPLEATIPANCGALSVADVPDTSTVGGETGGSTAPFLLVLAGAAVLGAAFATRRLSAGQR